MEPAAPHSPDAPRASRAHDLARVDEPLRDLFEQIAPHADLAAPDLAPIGDALSSLAADRDYFRSAIGAMGERSGAMPLHVPERGPRLFLVHRGAGQMSAVHDHGVWVALAPIVGVESHRRWRRDAAERARLELAEQRALAPTTHVTLRPPEDIHDHGHLLGVGDAAYVLILLGDDQFRYRRNEWDPVSGRRRTLEPGDRGRWLASDPLPG